MFIPSTVYENNITRMFTFSMSKCGGLSLYKTYLPNVNGTENTKIRYLLYVFDRSLRSLLDGEMEHSAGLRQETDLLKKKLAELEERHTGKVQALAR